MRLKAVRKFIRFSFPLLLFGSMVFLGYQNAVILAPTSTKARGWVDQAWQDGDNLRVTGWACAIGSPASVQVDLFFGGSYQNLGSFIGRFPASLPSEVSVAKECQSIGSNYRFHIQVPKSVWTKYQSQAIFLHVVDPRGGTNPLALQSGQFSVPLLAKSTERISIGSPGGKGWARDEINYFDKWKCTSSIGIKEIRRLRILPLGNHKTTQWKDSLVAGIVPGPQEVYYTLGEWPNKESDILFSMYKATFIDSTQSWNIEHYHSDLSIINGRPSGVSSHDGTDLDYIYNRYQVDGWGPYASRAGGKIPGVDPSTKELYGTGPLGLTTIKRLVNNLSSDLNVRTCLHMNPTLFDYDATGVPRSMLVSLWSGTRTTACLLPAGAPLAKLPEVGPYVYRYVNSTLGWQLDLGVGLLESQGDPDIAMNADPFKNTTFVRAEWWGKLHEFNARAKTSKTILDCSEGQLVTFSEASRGANGSYYFLGDEKPHNGSALGLEEWVYQHDVFVAIAPIAPEQNLFVFNADWYVQNYPDLKATYFKDLEGATKHWLNNGINEGRQGSPDFWVVTYLNRYPDLKASFGEKGYRAAINHYLTTGIKEGRSGRP